MTLPITSTKNLTQLETQLPQNILKKFEEYEHQMQECSTLVQQLTQKMGPSLKKLTESERAQFKDRVFYLNNALRQAIELTVKLGKKIDDLPRDKLEEIAFYLNFSDILKFRLINRTCYKYLKNEIFWKSYASTLFQPLVNYYQRNKKTPLNVDWERTVHSFEQLKVNFDDLQPRRISMDVDAMTCDPEGRLFIAKNSRKEVYEFKDGSINSVFSYASKGIVDRIEAISQDCFALSFKEEAGLSLYHVRSKKWQSCLEELPQGNKTISCSEILFHPDGRLVKVSFIKETFYLLWEQKYTLWQLKEGEKEKEIRQSYTHTGRDISSVCFFKEHTISTYTSECESWEKDGTVVKIDNMIHTEDEPTACIISFDDNQLVSMKDSGNVYFLNMMGNTLVPTKTFCCRLPSPLEIVSSGLWPVCDNFCIQVASNVIYTIIRVVHPSYDHVLGQLCLHKKNVQKIATLADGTFYILRDGRLDKYVNIRETLIKYQPKQKNPTSSVLSESTKKRKS